MTTKIFLPLLALLLVVGCSKSDYYSGGMAKSSISSMPAGVAYDLVQEADEYRSMYNLYGRDGSSEPNSLDSFAGIPERKLAMWASISIRVQDLDAVDVSLGGLLEKYGAYAASTSIYENSRSYSLRVPSAEYAVFLDEMSGMGKTLHRSETVEDVTLRYYDLDGRLATKKELQKTFQSYLGKAKNIEEILSVEARLIELQNEIEGTGKQLRDLANRVDFSSIELSLQGPVASTPYRGPTLGEQIKELFVDFKLFLYGLAVVIVGIIIYGVPILLLLVLFFWLFFGKIGLFRKLIKLVAGDKKFVRNHSVRKHRKLIY
ncbi:MAG: DUF4349 domain-containing protein [Treponema sp.]|jgi:hypothetical protein|nr:DUF4349 domain-containing protein [Treponema sp.]